MPNHHVIFHASNQPLINIYIYISFLLKAQTLLRISAEGLFKYNSMEDYLSHPTRPLRTSPVSNSGLANPGRSISSPVYMKKKTHVRTPTQNANNGGLPSKNKNVEIEEFSLHGFKKVYSRKNLTGLFAYLNSLKMNFCVSPILLNN